MNKKKFHLAGEVALLIVLLINSLGVDLMSKSGFGISTIPFLFRSRDRIWKNDRRTQRMDPGSAELPASSHDLFPGRILTGMLRYLPCQQLYASNHPDRYLPSRSVRYCKKEL